MSSDQDRHDEMLRQARLARWFTGMVTIVTATSTVMRPLFSEPGDVFTLIGTVTVAMFGTCWWAMHRGALVERAPDVLLGLATTLALPLILVSGGPNSQFMVLIPLYPLCGMLLGGRQLSISIAIFWLAAIPMTHYVAPYLPDLTGETYLASKATARTVWAILATAISVAFAVEFDSVRRQFESRLLAIVDRDPLTGIGNRKALEQALTRSLSYAARKGGSVAVLTLELDHFRRYNESRGFAAGDDALKSIAETIVGQCRAGQDTVVRFGGDEFVVVLGQTDAAGAAVVADKLRRAILELGLSYDNVTEDVLTVTVGYTAIEGGADTTHEELLRQADAALYAGKHLGRDRSVGYGEVTEDLVVLAAETRLQRQA